MMHKYFPLILCLLLLCTACGQANSLPRNPEELEEYAENIAEVRAIKEEIAEHIVTADALPADLEIPENASYCQKQDSGDFAHYIFYDADDNPFCSIICYNEEYSRTDIEYEYDENGRIAVERIKSPYEESSSHYTYNEDGTVKECTVYEDGEEKYHNQYEYNSHGDLVKTYHREGGKSSVIDDYEYQYDDKGRLVKQVSGGSIRFETEYLYDMQGQLVREIQRHIIQGELFKETLYGYDDAGRKLELRTIAGDPEIGIDEWFEYVYFDDPEETQ